MKTLRRCVQCPQALLSQTRVKGGIRIGCSREEDREVKGTMLCCLSRSSVTRVAVLLVIVVCGGGGVAAGASETGGQPVIYYNDVASLVASRPELVVPCQTLMKKD